MGGFVGTFATFHCPSSHLERVNSAARVTSVRARTRNYARTLLRSACNVFQTCTECSDNVLLIQYEATPAVDMPRRQYSRRSLDYFTLSSRSLTPFYFISILFQSCNLFFSPTSLFFPMQSRARLYCAKKCAWEKEKGRKKLYFVWRLLMYSLVSRLQIYILPRTGKEMELI